MPISLFCRIDGSWIAQSFLQQIKKVASGNANVHICGEIGTGKQIAATMIHSLSDRRAYPLITIDSAVHHTRRMWSKNVEDEEPPDAETERIIRSFFRQAGRGTLILDDISRMGLDLQEKLLHVLKATTSCAGEDGLTHVPHPRIVTTSHRNPQTFLRKGKIKSELYEHLHPVLISLNPLRDCKADIPVLANYYFNHYGNRPDIQELPGPVLRQLLDYDWPGNLYELQNTIQRYLVFDEIIFLPVRTESDKKNRLGNQDKHHPVEQRHQRGL